MRSQPTIEKPAYYQANLPNGTTTISSKPVTHKTVTEYDPGAILFLAILYHKKSKLLLNEDVNETKIPLFPVWNNIFLFLFGKSIQSAPIHLAKFSIAVARPNALSYAIDDVLRAIWDGDEALVFRMINSNPNYLLQPGKLVVPSGRVYENILPLQAALMGRHIQILQKMGGVFDRLPEGPAKMSQQFFAVYDNIQSYDLDYKDLAEPSLYLFYRPSPLISEKCLQQ